MYELQQTLENIKSYSIKLGFAIQNGKLLNLTEESLELEEISKQVELVPFGEENIVLNDLRGNSTVVNINSFQINTKFKINVLNYPYLGYYTQVTPRKYGIFDFYNKKVLFETTQWIGRDIVNSSVISKENRIITCRSIHNGELKWEFKLDELGHYYNQSNEKCAFEVKRIIGIHEKSMIFQLSNASIIFLNENTGQMIQKLELNETHPLPSPVFYDDNSKAHLLQNKLIWLNNQRLVEIDLTSCEVTIVHDFFNVAREHQYRFMNSILQDEKLYFTADYGWEYITASYIGVMDAQNGNIIWSKQIQKTGGISEPPQVYENNFSIRTNKGILHIFRKI